MTAPRIEHALIALLVVAGCSAATQSESPQVGWSLETDGDLNALLDCLAENEMTLVAAHRGGPAPGYPENAIETFAETLSEAPALLEIDVAASADGVLYLMHDDTLERTTTGEGDADETPWAEIGRLYLEDAAGTRTPFHPPRFSDALSWADGRTILKIDFKPSARYEDVIAEIDRQQAEDRVILIAYSLAQAKKLHRLAPDAMVSLKVASQSDLNRAVAAGIPAARIIGFAAREGDTRLFQTLAAQEVETDFGALIGGADSIDRDAEAEGDLIYAGIAADGADIITTDRPKEAQAALDAAGRGVRAGACGFERN